MAAALIIGGITAAASIYGAKKGSDAATKASEQQTQSADKALALQQQMYETTRQDLAPYRTQGQQGLTALSAFLGLPPAPAAAATPTGPMLPPGAPHATNPTQRPLTEPAVPRAMPLSQLGGAPAAGGGLVLLRAPTGQTQQVPADQVAYYLARGATRG